MKRKIIALLCMAVLSCTLVTGCAGAGGQTETAEESVSGSDAEAEEAAEQEKASETAEEPEASGQETAAEQDEVSGEEEPAAALEDGVYTADFDTDSSMFRVNEACEGKGTLTVENGGMVIHISLVSKNIVNLFSGSAEDAQKEGAEILEPTTDAVTYSDGMTEEVYGFDVPVPALDEEFDLAILGKKGTWYDHKVSVSNPEKAE